MGHQHCFASLTSSQAGLSLVHKRNVGRGVLGDFTLTCPSSSLTCVLTCVLLHAGLTKVPIDGQPKSIVKDLEDMARTYIKVT